MRYHFTPIRFLLLLLSPFSRVQLVATPWTVAYQAPLSMGFSRQEYRNGLPFLLFSKNCKIRSVREDVETGTFVHCLWECKTVQPLRKRAGQFFQKLSIELARC